MFRSVPYNAFTSLFVLFLYFAPDLVASEEKENYLLYDHQDFPRFLKLYITDHQMMIDELSLRETFKDSFGEFILVPILLNCWICPFCGNLNFNLVEICRSQNCRITLEQN